MNNPRVTVVIPSTGRSSLRRAVDSVALQTQPAKVIVVLDRPDQRDYVIEALGDCDAELIFTRGNCGGAHARNLGTDRAETDYVAYLDDDDWWEPSKVAHQVGLLDAQPDATLSSTYSFFHRHSGGTSLVPLREPQVNESIASYAVTRERITFGATCLQSSALLLRTTVAKSIRWEASLAKHQDWDFAIRVTKNSPERLVWVRQGLTHVSQGSHKSISQSPNWEGSASWINDRCDMVSPKARADFAATHILRSALARRSIAGILNAVRAAGTRPPHAAALLVGLSGIRGH